MVVEQNYPAFLEWFPWAFISWLTLLAILFLGLAFVGFLFSGLRLGPKKAFLLILQICKQVAADVVFVSPRRIGALATLTFKEAVRKKIVVGFIIFILIILFAGMFLDPTSPRPAQLYMGFIFNATGYLTILLILLLAAFSLPSDLQKKTIHTIVTKPVRTSEVILGRIVGFVLLGTALLLPMGVISYVFVVRSQSHTHVLSLEELQTIPGNYADGVSAPLQGKTSLARNHQHEVYIPPGGDSVQVSPKNEHTHSATVYTDADGRKRYRLGPPEDMFAARVVQYGALNYLDQRGVQTDKGINVGDEWEYRSFIAGATEAAFIWQFEDVTPERFPDGLPIEMVLEVFRTHKGEISRRVLGAIFVRNPETGLTLQVETYESQENEVAAFKIPRNIDLSAGNEDRQTALRAKVVPVRLPGREKETQVYPPENQCDFAGEGKVQFDLFEDFVAPESVRWAEDGRSVTRKNTIEIWVRCLERGQYFGAAQKDMYIRSSDASFAWNFVKGYLGIWLQMTIVAVYGVMFSTFLSTPVTILATLVIILGGYFHHFLNSLGMGTLLGGGPFEAAIRVFTQENLTIELDMNTAEIYISRMIDSVFQGVVWVIAHLIPDFGKFDCSGFVSQGFNIPFSVTLVNFATVLGFAIPIYIVATLLMKMREIER
ncbi:MAG: hypothetical protein Q4D38_01240 [Planctomycetia bacterium]|nr:hypothetical protein [Planctomycetia bacterium]